MADELGCAEVDLTRLRAPGHQDRLAQAGPRPTTTGERRPGTDEANEYAEHMDDLPVHLVVLVEEAALLAPWPVINQSTFAGGSSIYPFVQNVLLAIRAEGLGAALTMLLNNEEAEVKRLLNIPDGVALAAHIGVGWPAQPHPTRLRRRAVEDFTSVDRFGGEPLHIASSRPSVVGTAVSATRDESDLPTARLMG